MLALADWRNRRENSGKSSSTEAKLSQAQTRRYDACEGCIMRTEVSLLFPLFLARFEHREERLLGDVDLPNGFHAFLAFFLLLPQLALTRNVAAIAFRRNILPHRADRFAG